VGKSSGASRVLFDWTPQEGLSSKALEVEVREMGYARNKKFVQNFRAGKIILHRSAGCFFILQKHQPCIRLVKSGHESGPSSLHEDHMIVTLAAEWTVGMSRHYVNEIHSTVLHCSYIH
jgi:hypothetical protein